MQHYENIFFSCQKWCKDFMVNVAVLHLWIVGLHGCISILLSTKLEANYFMTLIYADDHKIHLDVTCWHLNSYIRAKCSEKIYICQRLHLHLHSLEIWKKSCPDDKEILPTIQRSSLQFKLTLKEVRERLSTFKRPWTNSPVSYLNEASALQRREHFLSVGVRKRQRVRTIWWETAAGSP